MRFDVLTLFPAMFGGVIEQSILGRAQRRGLLTVGLHDIRHWTHDRHRTCDDVPYGGGGGMVMKVEPLVAAIEAVAAEHPPDRVIVLSPQGRLFSQAIAAELASLSSLMLICGHYEGVDERVSLGWAHDELSIGDYVLTGGELAALVVIDAVARLVPGVLGNALAPWRESHSAGLLEHPQYTRPPVFRGLAVPDVLLSGDHARIERWRRRQSLLRTRERRPDLFAALPPAPDDAALLDDHDA